MYETTRNGIIAAECNIHRMRHCGRTASSLTCSSYKQHERSTSITYLHLIGETGEEIVVL